MLNGLGEVVATQFAQGFGQIINYKAVLVSEEFDSHFGHFPAGKVEMNPVKKG